MRSITLCLFFLPMFCAILAGASGSPENDFVFRVMPEQTRMSLTAELVSESSLVQGWSFGLCHDPQKASIIDFHPADELNFLLLGEPVGYMEYGLVHSARGTGIFHAVVVASLDPDHIIPPTPVGPFPEGLPSLHVSYEIYEESEVNFCSALGDPIVDVIVVKDGASLHPGEARSGLLLEPNYEQELTFSVTPQLSDGVVTVRLYSPTAAIQGWSFALCHWENKATIEAVTPAADVDILCGGDPVSYLHYQIIPGDTRAGVVQAVVIDFNGLSYGPYPEGIDLMHVDYQVFSNTEISFCDDTLGDPAVNNLMVIRGDSYTPPSSQMRGASLVTNTLSAQFIRGDVNRDNTINLGDAVMICQYAFGNENISCHDAADVNDNGMIDLADAIYLLTYLYNRGRDPFPPFPNAGADLTPEDYLNCER